MQESCAAFFAFVCFRPCFLQGRRLLEIPCFEGVVGVVVVVVVVVLVVVVIVGVVVVLVVE